MSFRDAIVYPNDQGTRYSTMNATPPVPSGKWFGLEVENGFVRIRLRGTGALVLVPVQNVAYMFVDESEPVTDAPKKSRAA